MTLFEQFIKTKPLIEETAHIKVYKLLNNGVNYKIIVPKKRANRHSIIHCIDDYIAWEQAPLFPRLVGRNHGIKTPIYKFSCEKDCYTLFIIKGKPNGIVGLDDGIFSSNTNFSDKNISIISYKYLKSL